MLILTIWTLLKSTGYINTPVWLEYGIPVGSFVMGLLGLYHRINKELNDMKIEMAKINIRLDHHDKDLESIDRDLHFIKKKMLA